MDEFLYFCAGLFLGFFLAAAMNAGAEEDER